MWIAKPKYLASSLSSSTLQKKFTYRPIFSILTDKYWLCNSIGCRPLHTPCFNYPFKLAVKGNPDTWDNMKFWILMNATILTHPVRSNLCFALLSLITLKIHPIYTFQTHANTYWQKLVIISVCEISSFS